MELKKLSRIEYKKVKSAAQQAARQEKVILDLREGIGSIYPESNNSKWNLNGADDNVINNSCASGEHPYKETFGANDIFQVNVEIPSGFDTFRVAEIEVELKNFEVIKITYAGKDLYNKNN